MPKKNFVFNLIKYLYYIDENNYKKLLNNSYKYISKKQFMKIYLAHLRSPNEKELNTIEYYKKIIINIFHENNLSNLNNLKYDVIISINNLENRMPYTIYNTIIFNENYLKKFHNLNKINNDFLKYLYMKFFISFNENIKKNFIIFI